MEEEQIKEQDKSNKIKNSRLAIFLPILFGIVLTGGIYIGAKLSGGGNSTINSLKIEAKDVNKLSLLMDYIEQEYVDEIDRKSFEEKIIKKVIDELDPHSAYISAEEMAAMNEPLEGNFDGIGVEFRMVKDTVTVINPVSGGPSEKVGIKAGDRIVKVDGKIIAGVKLADRDVMKLLKGPKNSKVKVEIVRKNLKKPIGVEITRGTIPIKSIDGAFMLDDEIGYFNIIRFSRTTHEEFVDASQELKELGMKKIIIDLRGNGGGYLDAAIKLADEFLINEELIVFTEGKSRPRQSYFSKTSGMFGGYPLAVLIDEGSASASEIFAGAIQDNDRGVIIGRRSFGKGLVQEQSGWRDGSAIRLTVSRYYTPSGRSIQKPYSDDEQEYNKETIERYEHGEFFVQDSITFADSLKYKTQKGRIVYGGGGIMPDVFVPLDTNGSSNYYLGLIYSGAFNAFSFDYVDKNRDKLSEIKDPKDFKLKFEKNQVFLKEFIEYANKMGIKYNEREFKAAEKKIISRLLSFTGRQIWSGNGFYFLSADIDENIQAAQKFLQSNVTELPEFRVSK